ncbi:MAG TPA: chloride channel protein [Fulvivirga sp.]|nr:chloride channel protein [Fulvivirga sp.]
MKDNSLKDKRFFFQSSRQEKRGMKSVKGENKIRLITISGIAFLVAVLVSFIAKFLFYLIDLITNISFYGSTSLDHTLPADNTLGLYVIIVPAIGGLIIGLMALYGSKAIRGHGIPEAMEQILTNQSKIKPTITYLKPVSSAISIGTGGPFGAEGPIIATGGALGSTIGQLLKISHNERKILLAAGATAGMAAVFGSPVAAIFLAVELLLFEFSPRSLIPVAIACITGAAGHHLFFGQMPVFGMGDIAVPSNYALFIYTLIGIAIGFMSIGVTNATYWIEDIFEKLPVHWMWWPAIGGLFVGVIGYFAPHTLGVGYENITDVLSGNMPLKFLLSLCFLKFISWAIALGSGTSGGTLAPLLTIGGAAGALVGIGITYLSPTAGITIPLAALVGMSAMFAGASRALLTSIIFSLETTAQSNALLPILVACLAAYIISFLFMKHTIMTKKIERRGVKTPYSYESDILERLSVNQVLKTKGVVFSESNTIKEVQEWLDEKKGNKSNYLIVSDNDGTYKGLLNSKNLFRGEHDEEKPIGSITKHNQTYVGGNDTLRTAVEIMAKEDVDILPVVASDNMDVIGVLSYRDIISTYKRDIEDYEKKQPSISLRRHSFKILLKGKKLVSLLKRDGENN